MRPISIFYDKPFFRFLKKTSPCIIWICKSLSSYKIFELVVHENWWNNSSQFHLCGRWMYDPVAVFQSREDLLYSPVFASRLPFKGLRDISLMVTPRLTAYTSKETQFALQSSAALKFNSNWTLMASHCC